jgi:hypothetical protein
MYAEPIGNNFQGYRCSSRRFDTGPCGSSSIAAHIIEGWVWEQVTNVLRNPELIAAEVQRRQMSGPDPMLTEGLANTRERLARIEKQQSGLGARLRDAADDAMLWDLLRSEIAKIKQEKTALQAAIVDMEERLMQQQHILDQLEMIPIYCARVAQNLDTFDFDEKRLALEALGIQIKANGREWQIEGRIPLDDGVVSQSS